MRGEPTSAIVDIASVTKQDGATCFKVSAVHAVLGEDPAPERADFVSLVGGETFGPPCVDLPAIEEIGRRTAIRLG
jgi:hypothetical protein